MGMVGKGLPMQRISNVPPVLPGSNFNELEYTQARLNIYDPDSHCCQRCGRLIWSNGKTASYKRFITWPRNGKPVTDEIHIPTYLCEECGKSEDGSGCENGNYHHAILPDNLIPFTQFTLLFVLTVLHDYFNHTRTVKQICLNWDISSTTLYAWRNRFRSHYDAWAGTFDSIRHLEEDSESTAMPSGTPPLAAALSQILNLLKRLVPGFFGRFLFSFMQACTKTHLRELPGRRRPRKRIHSASYSI